MISIFLGRSNNIVSGILVNCNISWKSTSVIIKGIEEVFSKSRVNNELVMISGKVEGLVDKF